ncbi:MAG: hypothetical protein NC400_13765 [Clostridium sp.]|nr:hypothetical protein [Clostridium sp.]
MKKKTLNLCLLSLTVFLTACSLKQNEKAEDSNLEPSSIEASTEIESSEKDTAKALSSIDETKIGINTDADTSNKPNGAETYARPSASEPAEAISRTIKQENLTSFFANSKEEPAPFELTLVSEVGNNISDVTGWFAENALYLPMANGPLFESAGQIYKDSSIDYDAWQSMNTPVFFDDNYIYEWSTENLIICDKENAQPKYNIQITSDWWSPMGNCAYMEDGILYIGSIYNGYAMQNTCYLLAYDVENDKVLWRSQDQTYNSANFIVKDDVIICSYGFTAEADYIYQISMRTGKVLSQTLVAKMPDLLVEKDGQLYVHTYSYDYVFDIAPLSP